MLKKVNVKRAFACLLVLFALMAALMAFGEGLIKLQARNCKVVIHGARLKIDYYTAEEMKITGQVGSLEFET